MNELSTEIRNYVIKFKNGDDEKRITAKQAKEITTALSNEKQSHIWIIGDDGFEKAIHRFDIESISKIEIKDTSGMKFTCSYGHKHIIREKCEHKEQYKIQPLVFEKDICHMFRLNYIQDCKEEMVTKYLQSEKYQERLKNKI